MPPDAQRPGTGTPGHRNNHFRPDSVTQGSDAGKGGGANGNGRRRRTKAEMVVLRQAIYEMAEANQPCSVRQLYYLGIGRYWDKDRGGSKANYRTVVRLTGELREDGVLPWGWIADYTRWVRGTDSFTSRKAALERWAGQYRRDRWEDQPTRVEVWCESDSIAGVLDQLTEPMGVDLFVCRGHSSKTYVHDAVQDYLHRDKPVTILYVGDWDPGGLAIPRSIEERVGRYGAGDVDVDVQRVAITADDVAGGSLASHNVNRNDSNHARFVDHARRMGLDPQVAIEVEALPPDELLARVESALDGSIEDPDAWVAVEQAEQSERELFQRLATGDTSGWSA